MRSWKTSLWGILGKKKKNLHFTQKRTVFIQLKVSVLRDDWKGTDARILTPCTQGCLRTCAALRRSVASRTSSLEMRSLAPPVMWAQSLSGNSYFPCWILSNNWLCGHKYPKVSHHCPGVKCCRGNSGGIFYSLFKTLLKWVFEVSVLICNSKDLSPRLGCCCRNLPS